MSEALTSDDPRYGELFDVAKETAAHGGQLFGDLTPAMNALRNRAPVIKGSLRELLDIPENHHAVTTVKRQHYTLLSFALCDRALRDNLLFSSAIYKESVGVQQLGKTILEMTGDEHRSYRNVVQPMFLRPKAINWWKPNWIDEAVNTLLDRLMDCETADLNLELCARLPVYIVTRGMGMSGDSALQFREKLLKSSVGSHALTPEQRMTAAAEVSKMLMELITARRQTPGDDVVSGLIANELALPDGSKRKLSDEEIFCYCRLIMLAGGGTTWRQLGITLHALLTNYHFWEACCDDRSLIEPAINEAARWMPTDPTFPRLVTADVELEGVLVPAGSRVDMCFGSANRDPSRWENPDEFDIYRAAQSHLGFGMGPHRCLGMEVAKQEMIAAINGLMNRFPRMTLDQQAPTPQLLGGLEQRGMSAIPVRLNK
jgi:cytochrome P450